MGSLRPAAIIADRQTGEFIITWSDGHESIYPFVLLRSACPCEECSGGQERAYLQVAPHVFMPRLDDSPAARLHNVEMLGSYAINIEWEDGHSYGIYSWDYLRALCPCSICRPDLDLQ